MTSAEPMTLRKLVDMLDPNYLDADLTIQVRDAHGNAAILAPPSDLWSMPRSPAVAQTGEPARLVLQVNLSPAKLRLVREK